MTEHDLAGRFRRWFSYECEAHERVWESLDSVPPENRTGEQFQGAVDLFAHILATRDLWLHRLGARSERPAEMLPRNTTRRQLQAWLEANRREWEDYLERLDDAELSRVVEYEAMDGHRYEHAVEEALTQLFTHAAYHRGQVATLLRGCGGTPAHTDFLIWSRRRVD